MGSLPTVPGSCRFNSARLKGKKSLREKKASVASAKYSIGLDKTSVVQPSIELV
jgi:hypothetical protein